MVTQTGGWMGHHCHPARVASKQLKNYIFISFMMASLKHKNVHDKVTDDCGSCLAVSG